MSDNTKVCADCGHPMRHNVPRLGDAGGWVHADTGASLCGPDGSGEMCPDCGGPLKDDFGGYRACFCRWGGKRPTSKDLEEALEQDRLRRFVRRFNA